MKWLIPKRLIQWRNSIHHKALEGLDADEWTDAIIAEIEAPMANET